MHQRRLVLRDSTHETGPVYLTPCGNSDAAATQAELIAGAGRGRVG